MAVYRNRSRPPAASLRFARPLLLLFTAVVRRNADRSPAPDPNKIGPFILDLTVFTVKRLISLCA